MTRKEKAISEQSQLVSVLASYLTPAVSVFSAELHQPKTIRSLAHLSKKSKKPCLKKKAPSKPVTKVLASSKSIAKPA
ncbi:hypothetical protein, partial [Vibrio cholerae]|uniref:hypothetical protein n=1 Tax=Vibrio cholerae TaxID=666 RepID=UPI001C3CA435